MARDDADSPRDPERKRNSAGAGADARSTSARERTAAAWTPRRGRSGYGLESIRPHLRAQLDQQRLLRPTFPPESDDDTWLDPHLDRPAGR